MDTPWLEYLMQFYLFLHQILDDAQKHKGHILIRKQNCMGCNSVLAVEITDKLGSRGEYWVVKSSNRFKEGIDLLYGKEVWFGNFVKCPKCGREGRLPMDKPLNAESIAQPKEVKDGKAKEVLGGKTGQGQNVHQGGGETVQYQ